MLIRCIIILAITYAVVTYALHLSPEQRMTAYAAALTILFPLVEVYVHTRS